MLTNRKIATSRPIAFQARPTVPVQKVTIPWSAKHPATQGRFAGMNWLQAVVRDIADKLVAHEGLFQQMQRARLEFQLRQWILARWPTFTACHAEIGFGDDTMGDIGQLMFSLWYLGWDAAYRGKHYQRCDTSRQWDPYYLQCV